MNKCIRAVVLIGLLSIVSTAPAEEPRRPAWGRMDQMRPDELEGVLEATPVAFVPLGTYEHHGWHLPVCFDAIKADALCRRVAERTGGVVLPPFFYGTGGGHGDYKWTIILPEEQIRPILETTLDHLSRFGFRVVVVLTGHYPREQVDMVHRLAEEAGKRNPKTHYIGLTEPEVTTPLPGDRMGGDHAAKYETSIAMALNPDWVSMDALTADHDPDRVTLPNTPQTDRPTHNPKHPLYAIHGQDPREHASAARGRALVDEIVRRAIERYEPYLDQRPIGMSFAEAYDPATVTPQPAWLARYEKVKEEAAAWGMPLD